MLPVGLFVYFSGLNFGSCVACAVLGSFRAEQVLYFVAVACFCLRVQ